MNFIYHHTDADGYASAAVATLYIHKSNKMFDNHWKTNDIKYIPYCYEPLDTFVPYDVGDFNEGDNIFIVDLSVSIATLEKFVLFIEMLYKKKCHLVWIDHHRSSVDTEIENVIKKRFEIYGFERYIDIEYCAAYNAFTYLIVNKFGHKCIPEILRVIDDYDCWKLKLAGTKEFIDGFAVDDVQLPQNPKWSEWLMDRASSLSIIRDCIYKGNVIKAWQNIDDTNKFNMSAFETTLCGLSCCALNVRRNSDIFRTDKKYDILLSYIFDGDKYKCSIYSTNPDVQCNIIAQMFGGGGHKGAAGFTTKKLVVRKNKNILYKIKENYRARKYNKLKK